MEDHYVMKIVKWLGRTPEVDGFASEANHRFPRWWVRGSPYAQDGFAETCSGKLLWINPPFSTLTRWSANSGGKRQKPFW